MKRKKTYWISFDLGLRGDYQGLYTWLDNNNAMECGNSIAVIHTKLEGDLVEVVTKEIKKAVNFSTSDRVYIIYKDDITNKTKGKFIVGGGRKRAPWEGYKQSLVDAPFEDVEQ